MMSSLSSAISFGALVIAASSAPSADPPPLTAAGANPTTANSAPPESEEDETAIEEVVVTGHRDEPGAVIGDVKPALQITPAVIQSYGVSTVSELLDELAPQIRSDKNHGAEPPIVLLNGRRIAGLSEVRDIPAEAIARIDVLPEEAALKYGYPPDQRVLNFVLRRRFKATSTDLKGVAATAGGNDGGEAELDHFRVRHGSRSNFDLKYQHLSDVTEAERALTPFPQVHPFDRLGNVVSPTPGAEIDPALSALVGMPVTIAGVPAIPAAQPLTLGDFAATAGNPNVTDVRRFRTLTPTTDNLSANALLARPVSEHFELSLNANLIAAYARSELGLPGVQLQVPAGDPFSPFGTAVEVDRFAAAPGALQRRSQSWTGHVGSALNGDTHGWRVSATSAFDHTDVMTRSDAGADATAIQALLDQRAPTLDPFRAPLVLPERPANRGRSRLDSIDLTLVASGPLFRLPAGSVYGSFRSGDTQAWLDASTESAAPSQSSRLARNDFSTRTSLDVPLVRGLWLNGHAGIDQISRFGALESFGYGANWLPTARVNLIVSYSHKETAPSLSQLGDPLVFDRSYLFDFATAQPLDVRRLTGGDPGLVPERHNDFKVGLKLDPLLRHNLILSATYLASRADNPIETIPAATNAIQQAFPTRFVRDAAGQLVEWDDSPINFAQERRRLLRSGIDYSRRWGARESRRVLTAGPSQAQDAAGTAPSHRFPGRTASLMGTSLQLALYHTVYFEDALKLRAQDAPLNLLDGAPLNVLGGRPRHELEAQAGVTRNGLGARLSMNWRSTTAIRDAAPGALEDFTFSRGPRLDVRLFSNFDGRPELLERHPLLKGVRLTIAVTDVLDSQVRVRSATGAAPLSYQPAILDPVGRVVRVSFRMLLE